MNSVHPSKKNSNIIGWLNGRPMYRIAGSSGEGTGSDSTGDQPNDDAEDEDDEDDPDGASGSGDDQEDDSDDEPAESELDKQKKRLKAADRHNSKLQKRIKELEDKDKSEVERLQGSEKELREQLDKVQPELSSLRLENAFLKANEITWHKPGVAISIAQTQGYLEGVVDEETGEVDEKLLKAALSKLGKEHEYLVKKGNSDQKQGPSGQKGPDGRGGSRTDDKAKKEKLRQRFPALGR